MKKYCPNARIVGKAILPNWEVQFNFLSRTYNGGATGIEPAIGKIVRGVVYDVPDEEMIVLDKVEGTHEGIYFRQTVIVVDEQGRPVKAATYRTTNPRGPYKPTKKYLSLMIKGAKEHRLDEEYIKELEKIDTLD
ncbi:gamma-glutamylcyclotransferase [Candidatus Bathyarchaeota archaeon]|nr:gamma-glutamylcyclotransferase [Candidatus Bathyarchaeota archaeon]